MPSFVVCKSQRHRAAREEAWGQATDGIERVSHTWAVLHRQHQLRLAVAVADG